MDYQDVKKFLEWLTIDARYFSSIFANGWSFESKKQLGYGAYSVTVTPPSLPLGARAYNDVSEDELVRAIYIVHEARAGQEKSVIDNLNILFTPKITEPQGIMMDESRLSGNWTNTE